MPQKIIKIKLDGRQSYSFPIVLKRNNRTLDEPVDIYVRGFLKFENPEISNPTDSTGSSNQESILKSFLDKEVFYPVLFTFTETTVPAGRMVVTLLPRAEDLLQTTSTLEIRAEVSPVVDETIFIGTGVSSNELLKDPDQTPATIIITTGKIRTPYTISIEITVLDTSLFGQTIDIITTGDSLTGFSLFNYTKTSQSDNLLIECFSDDDWVPSIRALLGDNAGTASQALQKIEDLENSTPFGSSTLFDAIVESAEILSDNDIEGLRKLIYVFTDNDVNLSVNTLDQAITAVNRIDGDNEVPVLVGNLAIVRPITLSVKASISDTRDINKLGFFTGGQSVTLVTEDGVDDIVTIFYSSAVGALGTGTFDFTVDLGEEVFLSSIRTLIDLPDDRANASWEISTSNNDFVFERLEDSYGPNETATFDDTFVRYIRFHVTLLTGFSSEVDEYLTLASSPALFEVQITFNKSETVFLFLNAKEEDDPPSQLVIAVDANNDIINMDQIEAGMAKSDAHNWNDFYNEGQPFVDQNGKVVVPLRFSNNIQEFQREPLDKVDRFTLKTSYGRWDPFSAVILYDKEDNEISSDNYYAYPRDGLIVMSSMLDYNYKDGDFKIDVINTQTHKIGLRLTNKSYLKGLEIFGIGKMFTSGRSLDPPLDKVPPEAKNVVVSPNRPGVYSKMSVSYDFFDINFDKENTGKAVIKWYINDVHINYLDDFTTWNDVDNANDPLFDKALSFTIADLATGETVIEKAQVNGESILKVGDKVHYTIKVSDGDLLSGLVKSNVVQVFQEKPAVKEVVVKGLLPDGTITERITANNDAIVQFNFQSDVDENETDIVWYVDGTEFKRGKVGDEPGFGGCPITQICPAEVSVGNLQVGLVMLNEIFVQVTPVSRGIIGDTVQSDTVVVKNALPEVSEVALTPNSPNQFEDLFLKWEFFDFEIDALDDPSQTDTSTVQWFRKNPGATDFEEVADTTSLAQIVTNINGRTSVVSNSLVFVDQEWYAKVTPNDSLDDGIPVDSNIVTIHAGSN
tara:strand:+ start:20195 stop:23269 length:3075 start_codon:yes stop_codon:yes gene_type:complete